MKKLLSLALILQFFITYSVTTKAWVPTDFKDAKCIDLRELGKTKDLIMLGQNGEKICGCKKCTVDAVLYNRLEYYIGMLETRFNELKKEKVSQWSAFFPICDLKTKLEIEFENEIKLNNIKTILKDIKKEIENKNFLNASFLLVSTNYDPNDPYAIGQFAINDDIIALKNNYDEQYFDDIKNKKIVPLFNKVKAAMLKSKNKNIGE